MERTERWFVGRGLPHFIEDYSASRDVLTRAVPLLTLILLFEVAGATKFDWPLWLNVVAAAGGLTVVLAAWAGVNALRQRPVLARPGRVGPVEVAMFVLTPAALPLIFGAQERSALATAAANALLLFAIYVGTSYGVVPMARWAVLRMARQLGSIFGLLVRALPLLLLFVTFLFVNAEVWQVAGQMESPFLAATVGLFVVVGTLFVALRLPREIGQLATFDEGPVFVQLLQGTPLEGTDVPPPARPPLSTRQWVNVGLLMFFGQALQIVTVSVLIGAFFMLFGLLTVTPEVIESWTGQVPDVVARFDLWGRDVQLTGELLRVSAFLSGFSGLYFTVTMLTDATYRQEFLEDVVGEVRQAFAVRAAYLAEQTRLRASTAASIDGL
jgi:small neutral amino acid transporter SnatA (MarC family)